MNPGEKWKPFRQPLPKGEHPHKPPEGFKILGKRIPLIDGPLKVSGQAVYTDDIQLPHMLIAKFLHSTKPHARIKRIDTSAARDLPGVVEILTGADIGPDRKFGVLPLTKDEEPLPTDKVRYIGDLVAIVAAEDEWSAKEAVRRIVVEYEDLPTYLKPSEGLSAVAEKIHPDVGIDGSNVQKHVDQEFGDVEEGFRGAALKLQQKWKFQGVTHAFTEPHAVIAHYTAGDRLTVWSATQVPHYVHRALAETTKLPMHKIQVIRPHVGGGFGGKSDPFAHEMATALLAMKTRRPVKLLFDRDESFYSGRGRHPTENEFTMAFDLDGTIRGLDIEAVIDGGAFASFGIISTYYNGVLSMGPYKVPAFRYKGRRVYTNHVPSGAMRGHGAVNSRCSLEVMMDEAAEQLGIDPFEIRHRNLMSPYSKTINDFRITSNGLKECLDTVQKASKWDEKWRKMPLGKGLGLGCGFYISGSNKPIHWDVPGMPQSTVHIKIDMDGGVTVHTGAAEIGQGSDTVAAICVAEVLGIKLDRIRIYAQSSDLAPIDLGSYSSRVTFMMGNAARLAAEQIRKELQQAAAAITHSQPEKFVCQDEFLINQANPTERVSFLDAVRKAMDHKGALIARGAFNESMVGGEFKGAAAGTAPAYSMNAYVAEVEVDLDTAIWRCTKVWAAHDCGKALNKLAVEGQIEGSIHMGLGQVYSESMEYRHGNLRNPNLLDYKIPTSLEMPDVDVFIIESNDPEGPFGAKEAGEGPLLPILPAVVNAIHDAVGIRMHELPITPDRLHDTMRLQGGWKKPALPGKPVVRVGLGGRTT
ncbi:MAG TPA: xanthine dehydrogenase family protein molybdopterin-binding subunit [Candidatus Thermoplasmatota archaeon]